VTPVTRDKLNSDAQSVSVLTNLRPQHLTEALLIRPIDPLSKSVMYAQSEFFQSERDPTKSEASERIVRGYYLLEELQPTSAGVAKLLGRFWFDRINGNRVSEVAILR
jgi:hypothetical protein